MREVERGCLESRAETEYLTGAFVPLATAAPMPIIAMMMAGAVVLLVVVVVVGVGVVGVIWRLLFLLLLLLLLFFSLLRALTASTQPTRRGVFSKIHPAPFLGFFRGRCSCFFEGGSPGRVGGKGLGYIHVLKWVCSRVCLKVC